MWGNGVLGTRCSGAGETKTSRLAARFAGTGVVSASLKAKVRIRTLDRHKKNTSIAPKALGHKVND